MLCCDTCGTELRDFEDLAVFVSQLARLGADARIHVRSVPAGLGRNVQFDVAPYLVDRPLAEGDRVVLLGAHRLGDEKLVALRRIVRGPGACIAFGAFASRQAVIGTRAKLSYVFGAEPEVQDLGGSAPGGGIGAGSGGPLVGVPKRTRAAAPPRILLVRPDLADRRESSAIVALALSRRYRVAILTDGRAKRDWLAMRGTEPPAYHFGEVLPADLAERVDICVSFAPAEGNYRLETLFANLARSGAALVDSTPGHAIAGTADAFLRGPTDPVTLGPFLDTEILPNLDEISRATAASRTAARAASGPLLRLLGAAPAPAPAQPRQTGAEIAFVPTNGIGLGHARRCSLIASEMAGAPKPVFAAFPSCLSLVKSYGFDVMPLIGRSAFHQQSFENDLANYIRLRALTAGGKALVFDGGYVFDSIYRTILENRLRGVWIRRGLWQATQNNIVALDREKVFSRVVVPREAFEELNTDYSRGPQVREVGPIVARPALSASDRQALRAGLSERYGIAFDRLVVSLLGGGVAADRSAQTQALCSIAERRSDTLHLVVVWPGGRQEPAWFGWDRTRVVRTQRAGALVAAADLCISAAGYNLFHETLYAGAPTIFVPQTGPFMDDQRARAGAAAERGLAATVDPHEMMRLDREVARFLDGGEAEATARRIGLADLPEPGNRAAAELIAEVTDGDTGLFGDPVAHRSAERR